MPSIISATVGKPSEVKRVYVYKIDHDLGVNPNPFGPFCTLAHCKGYMRDVIANYIHGQQKDSSDLSVADMGIWVIGIAGSRLGKERYGRIVYAMQVTEVPTYEEYRADSRFAYKKPVLTCKEEEQIKIDDKHNFKFYRNNRKYQICGDNQEAKDDDCNSKGVPYKHVLVSDEFEYYGADSDKQKNSSMIYV